MMVRALRRTAWVAAWIIGTGCAVWTIGAIFYDFPWLAIRETAAVIFAVAMISVVAFIPGNWRKLAALLGGFFLVLAWWLTLKASNTRNWQPDVVQTAWAQIEDDVVTLHNVRCCEYRAETDYTPRWETRTVRLSQLTGVDLAITYWGSPWIAHVIASFQFADAPPVCLSIETRMEVGETYSALAGFYRQYELIYVVADERDVIRVRTNFRQGESVYLYRTTATPGESRERFQEYLRALNALRENPRWYNAITANCLTSIRAQRDPAQRSRWDWRLLLAGKFDEMLFERGDLVSHGRSFAQLKAQSLINPLAQAAGDARDFSMRIRAAWISEESQNQSIK